MPRRKTEVKIDINEALIRSDIKKYRENIALALSKDLANDVEKWMRQAIDAYYDDYEPFEYERTDEIRNHSFMKKDGVHINGDKSYYFSGVFFKMGSSVFTDHPIKGIDEVGIIDYALFEGTHGVHKSGKYFEPNYGKKRIAPAEVVQNRIDISAKNPFYVQKKLNRAKREARNESYKYIKFYSRY